MSKSRKLFKDLSISNKVSRNGFDLSFTNKFTAKCGELLPLMHRNVMPGDKFRISVHGFSRTRPVQTAAYTKINEYYDFFFVPYRLIGKQLPHVLSQDRDNPSIALSSSSSADVGTGLPFTSLGILRGESVVNVQHYLSDENYKNNEFDFNRCALSHKLLNHLGYCFVDEDSIRLNAEEGHLPSDSFAIDSQVSLLPLACYQKIYYDFYRNTQWEDNIPYNYNFDYMSSYRQFVIPTTSAYWSNPTMFDLRYANYPKDLFFGLIPNSQYGDTAVVDVDNFTSTKDSMPVFTSNKEMVGVGLPINKDGIIGNTLVDASDASDLPGGTSLKFYLNDYTNSLSAEFSILEWRKANFVQKYREIMGSGRKDMKSIIQKIFNVDIPDTLSDMVTYLGGHSQSINISEVENTNLSGDNQAIQRGKGIGSGDSSLIEFDVTEFGCIMCIYHAQPVIDYALNAYHFDVVKTNVDDFANPVFDKLGYQEFPLYFLDNGYNNQGVENKFIGYTSRYFDYKTSVDVVLGGFRNELYDWVAPVKEEYLRDMYVGEKHQKKEFILTANFFKVNPSLLDSIFDVNVDSYESTDQLRVNAKFDIHAVRNLDYIGLPY